MRTSRDPEQMIADDIGELVDTGKSAARRGLRWARENDLKDAPRQLREEARRRGHEKRTAYAGVGGLLGGLLGSFRGPLGAGLGALLGAVLGAFLGMNRDGRAAPRLPKARRTTIVPRDERRRERVPVRRRRGAREVIDVEWSEA